MAASSLLLSVFLVAAAVHTGSCLTCYSCTNFIMTSEDSATNSALAPFNTVDAKCTQDLENFATSPPGSITCPSTSTICSKLDVSFSATVLGVAFSYRGQGSTTGVTCTVNVEMVSRGCGDPTWGAQGDGCEGANTYKSNLNSALGSSISISGDLGGQACGCDGGDLCNSATSVIISTSLVLAALIASKLF